MTLKYCHCHRQCTYRLKTLVRFLINSFSNCGRILYSLVFEILDVEVTTLTEYDLQMSFKVISHQKWHQSKAISSLW